VRRHRVAAMGLAGTLLAASVAIGGPTVAQSPSPTPAPTPQPGQTELNFTVFGDMGLDELVAQYQKDHPDIFINFIQAGYQEHHDQLLTQLATGDVPDIAAIEVGFMSKFKAQPENFKNLYDYGAKDIEGNYLPWRWEQAVSADGSSVIGIPTDVGGMALCYRTDLFKAAGLPTDPAAVSALWPTWDDFIKTGQAYVTGSGGKKFIDSAQGTIFNLVARQGNEEYYKTNDPLTTVYDTNPQVKLAWDLAVKASQAGISANIPQFAAPWNAAMSGDAFAALGCPAWMMGYIQSQAPSTAGNWNIAAIPGAAGNWGGTHLTIPAAAAHPKEAWDFINWALSPENQLEVFKLHGNFPSTPALYSTPDIQDFTNPFFSNAPVGKIYAASAEAVKPIFEGVNQREIDVAFGNGLGRIEDGKQTPDESWAQVMTEAQLATQQ